MFSELSTSVIELRRLVVVVMLHTEVDPTAGDWDRAMTHLTELRRARKVTVDRMRQIVVSDGGAPNALQRNRFLRNVYDGLPHKLAVVTSVLPSNPVKRGIATALSWTNPAIRFYEPEEFLEALGYLDLAGDGEAIWCEYQKLQALLVPVDTLRRIEATALDRGTPLGGPGQARGRV